MQTMWNFMHSRPDFKEAQSAAIFSWSLLLSSMDSWNLSYKHWRGAITFFKNLLESDNESIVDGTRQALSLILELGCLEKFEGDTPAEEDLNVEKFLELNFVRRLLGSGFIIHMRDNELLHDVFKFKPEKRELGKEFYVAERDEIAVNLFVPDVRSKDSFQRTHKSLNSIFVKARTQIRNKHRDNKGDEQCRSGD